MSNPVHAKAIAEFLGLPLVGDDVDIKSPATIGDARLGNLIFAKKFDVDLCEKVNALEKCLALVPLQFGGKLKVPHILCENPRSAFIQTLNKYFKPPNRVGIHSTAVVGVGTTIGDDVYLGPYVVVGGNCTIGNGSTIHGHVTIYDNIQIGCNVVINANTVVGADGFGYERLPSGEMAKFPHLGRVVIEDDVEIGSNTSIDRGTLGDTIIRRGACIDNLVHVAHNVDIGADSVVIALSMLGGSVKIGARSWIAPSTCIKNGIQIGEDTLVGLGAVVVKDAEPGVVLMGNPARPQKEMQIIQDYLKALVAKGTLN